jgi:hypothetical protein
MAKWAFTANNLTFTNVADTSAFTANGFAIIQGGSGTQSILMKEIYMGGLATVTSPMQVIVARDSTVCAATISGGTNAAFDPATAALAAAQLPGTTTSGTKGQRSATLYLLTPAFNANGGIVRWLAGPDEELFLLGNTASFGEMSITTIAGTVGAVSLHWVYEPK